MPDRKTLEQSLIALMTARRKSPNLARLLYCSKNISNVHALYGERLLSSVAQFPKEERLSILAWLSKNGPFLDDEREVIDEDMYHMHNIEVTDLGPGEAARQCQRGHDGRLFSFTHRIDIDFAVTPLPVIHGFPDEPKAEVPVPNIWSFERAQAEANAIDPEPESWQELMDVARRRYGQLSIGTHCDRTLTPITFYPVVARRTLELLRVLNEIMNFRDSNGMLSKPGEELVQMHFVGKKAWFTGESDENMREFGAAMTFPDPTDSARSLQCFWHGKIKTPQFRIHFEWPVPAKQTVMKIAYIGPKISKK